MNTYKNKCNSLCQREQSFEFMDEECDLDEEILSEGATAKSAVFESNIQLSMKKTIFKTKRIARCEKKLLVFTTNKENIDLEHSQAVERSEVLFEAKSIPNSPSSYFANKEESKLIYSCGKINTSCPSPNTLKDEISQLLRCLARKRNASTFKLTSNKPELISELENKDCSNLDVNIKISSLHLNNKYNSTSQQKSPLHKQCNIRNIMTINDLKHPNEVTMNDVLPNCDLDKLFC